MTDTTGPREGLPADHPLLRFTRGDEARASQLHERLSQIADRTEDPELHDLLRDVAAGRRDARELGSSEVFGRQVASSYEEFARRSAEKSTQERLDDSIAARAEVERVLGDRFADITRRFHDRADRLGRATDD